MPIVNEIFLYHIIFCRYPDIPVPFLFFFPQVRQRQFVQDTGTDLFRDNRQYFSAGPSIEELFKTSARQAPATLVSFGYGPHVYAALFFKKMRRESLGFIQRSFLPIERLATLFPIRWD
jgi:hypothetical protein